ncbi:MAG TPA: rhodanese-like domain-containing protein [Geobacter sp.]|nr:rhodanese-like domain-containing protein [Geobacter sp.]
MLKNSWLGTAAEAVVIVAISTVLGLSWNRTLLTGAWKGEPTQQVEVAQQGAVLPMPIGLAQVKELSDAGQALLVDARSSASYAEEHIAGALTLPLEEARGKSASLRGRFPAGATIIAYCNGFSCHDSMELGKLLIQAGYSSVYVFEGGLPEWRDAGHPVAKGGK